MNRLVITNDNRDALDGVSENLAETYRNAFAGEPWYEVDRCENEGCSEGFSAEEQGSKCTCGECRVEAYNSDQLVEGWGRILTEGGIIEVALTGGYPVRATIARPTTPSELFGRKYSNVPAMKEWLASNIPERIVWIEDTFANRNVQPKGNLADRGKTLKLLADYYGSSIATRTLASQIVRATLKAEPGRTNVWIGSNEVGFGIVNVALNNPDYLPRVPDARTFMLISAGVSQ